MLEILKNLENLLTNSINECITNNLNSATDKIGVVLSGGVDSSTIAFLSKKFIKRFSVVCYTAGEKDSDDIKFVKRLKDESPDLNFKIIEISEEQIKENIENLKKILKDNNIAINKINISTGIPIYFISRAASEDNIKLIISGQGADEIFGGYYRYLKMFNNKDEIIKNMENDVKNAYAENLNREISIASNYKIKIAYPYINEKFLNFALSLPIDLKIHEIKDPDEEEEFKDCIDYVNGKKFIRKYILRKFAKFIGVPDFIVKRKKKALQYGSKSEIMLKKMKII